MKPYIRILRLISALGPIYLHGHSYKKEEIIQRSEDLTDLIEELGPTYIKLGQILSVRFDLLPRHTCFALQRLLDNDSPIDFDIFREVIITELGEKYERDIARIDPDPIGVASIGQVHRAQLTDGTEVVIKVRKPGVEETIKNDIKAVNNILNIADKFKSIRNLSVKPIFHEFTAWVLKELDYSIEAANQEKFRTQFEDDPHIIAPRVFRNLSTDSVLVSEYIEGMSTKEALELLTDSGRDNLTINGKKIDLQYILDLMCESIFKQLFVTGFVHGDPHPSNIIIVDTDKIAYIDFGLAVQISKHNQMEFRNLFLNIEAQNYEEVIRFVLDVDQVPGSDEPEKIIAALRPIFEKYETSIPEEYSPTQFLMDMLYHMGQTGIQPPMFFVIISKIMATYDGMLQIIDPTIIFWEKLLPYFKKEVASEITKKFSFDKLQSKTTEGIKSVEELIQLALDFPKESNALLNEIKTSGIKVNQSNTASITPQADYTNTVEEILLFSYLLISILAFIFSLTITTSFKFIGLEVQTVLLINWCISMLGTGIYVVNERTKK